MIKSTKVSLKFTNKTKLHDLNSLIEEYRRVAGLFIDILWEMDKIPALIPKTITGSVKTWLSARMIQCAGKQASGIVRGVRKKYDQRSWVIERLKTEGKFKQARKLAGTHKRRGITKPNHNNVLPELDSRFIDIDLENNTSFDGWITISSIGKSLKIKIPFKKTRHFNELYKIGSLKGGVRLSTNNITLLFDIPIPLQKPSGECIGIDIGFIDILTTSNGSQISSDPHGHTLQSICNTLSRKTYGSKGFLKAQRHREQFLRWSVKQIDFSNVRIVRLENFKLLRQRTRCSRLLSHWNYADIFGALNSMLALQGVLVEKVSSPFTSQRCSVCGWVRKRNRKGKRFKCTSCGFTLDADLNASRNIALGLPPVEEVKRLEKANKAGFYWLAPGQEAMVPDIHKLQDTRCFVEPC